MCRVVGTCSTPGFTRASMCWDSARVIWEMHIVGFVWGVLRNRLRISVATPFSRSLSSKLLHQLELLPQWSSHFFFFFPKLVHHSSIVKIKSPFCWWCDVCWLFVRLIWIHEILGNETKGFNEWGCEIDLQGNIFKHRIWVPNICLFEICYPVIVSLNVYLDKNWKISSINFIVKLCDFILVLPHNENQSLAYLNTNLKQV